MTTTRFASLPVLCLAVLAACGGGSVSLDELPAKEAHVSCAALNRCLGPVATVLVGDSNCDALETTQLTNRDIATLRAEVDAGKVVYHAELAQACLDAIAMIDCTQIADIHRIPACTAAATGTVATGGACGIDLECSGDAYCDTGMACPGTCKARVGSGHACTTSSACTLGLVCDRTMVCSPPAGVGMACRGPTGPDCAPSLTCMGDTPAAPGTCVSLTSQFTAALGATCNPMGGPFCAAGLSCAAQSPTSFLCESTVGSGAACKVALPDECPSGQFCMTSAPTVLTGTCAALPGEGQPCHRGPGGEVDACLGDLACIGGTSAMVPGTCMARVANGGACMDPNQCWSGTCTASVCGPPVACP